MDSKLSSTSESLGISRRESEEGKEHKGQWGTEETPQDINWKELAKEYAKRPFEELTEKLAEIQITTIVMHAWS